MQNKTASHYFHNPDALSKKHVSKLLWESKCGRIRAYEVWFSKKIADINANGGIRHETNEEVIERVNLGDAGKGTVRWEWYGWSLSGERSWVPTEAGAAPVYLRMLRELSDQDTDWSEFLPHDHENKESFDGGVRT